MQHIILFIQVCASICAFVDDLVCIQYAFTVHMRLNTLNHCIYTSKIYLLHTQQGWATSYIISTLKSFGCVFLNSLETIFKGWKTPIFFKKHDSSTKLDQSLLQNIQYHQISISLLNMFSIISMTNGITFIKIPETNNRSFLDRIFRNYRKRWALEDPVGAIEQTTQLTQKAHFSKYNIHFFVKEH